MERIYELSWVEDYNHNLAGDCLLGLQDLIDAGVFPDIEASVKDDTLTIKGPEDQVNKAIDKIQDKYVEYGQIIVKEMKTEAMVAEALKIKSFDENVQDIFNHTAAYFAKFKSTSAKKRPSNYIAKLNEFQLKFMKFKKVASDEDKPRIQEYINEVQNLLDEEEGISPIEVKPIGHKGRKMKRKSEYKEKEYRSIVNPNDGGEYWDGPVHVYEAPADNEAFKIQQAIDLCEENGIHVAYNTAIKQQLSDPKNWGIIEESNHEEDYYTESIIDYLMNKYKLDFNTAQKITDEQIDVILEDLEDGFAVPECAEHVAYQADLK